MKHMPSFDFGDAVEARYGSPVAGVDEVGRGPLAGPVVAAAVIIMDKSAFLKNFENVNDSKALSKKNREILCARLMECDFVEFAIGEASPEEIDEKNIRNATFIAMTRALTTLHDVISDPQNLCDTFLDLCPAALDSRNVPHNSRQAPLNWQKASLFACERPNDAPSLSYIVDGNALPTDSFPGQYLVKGDQKSYRIATASIIAKVYRDNLMASLAKEFPQYGWDANAGYGTKQHLDALKEFGPSPYHRKTFTKVKA
jgi:ribonuclease HII